MDTLAPLPGTAHRIHRLETLRERGIGDIPRLPMTVKILLENLLREQASGLASDTDVRALASWPAPAPEDAQLPFTPARVLLQDFTGVPAVVDLAAMRAAMDRAGKDPKRIDPLVQVDVVIDHSVQVDAYGTADAYRRNLEREFERNAERYSVFRWAQQAFQNFRVVPPGMGICHQVNLERLSTLVQVKDGVAYYDTLVGADSHTTMVNGLGVLGWGVGGIEAEAAMLGQPMYLPVPVVIGVRLSGSLRPGVTATDFVLTLTELFRKHGVVDKFVEFCGAGLSSLSVPDRATLSNMCPDYGATASFFPIDERSLEYLEQTGRGDLVPLVRTYATAQGLFRTDASPIPTFTELIDFDLSTVEPSLAGPKRPQDRVGLAGVRASFFRGSPPAGEAGRGAGGGTAVAEKAPVENGSVVLAAITSCTNTSNPSVMVAAGLVARKAVERGLRVPATVKPSLAPGSRVVTDYLDDAGLSPFLDQLGFNLVGYGCTTCIAEGTPVLQANGTSRRIEDLPEDGGSFIFGPAPDGGLGIARQTKRFAQGTRECVSLVFQDGRTLVCTPDHRLLRADGRWTRADELEPGRDRVIAGLEAPLDVPGPAERGYELRAGKLVFAMDSAQARAQTLAFARLLGHLLGDGSISVAGQARMNVGQAVDREAVLRDVELVTGKRPAGSRYDERKWSIALPSELSAAIVALPGVRTGVRMMQAPALPAFVLDRECPASVVREFLGGVFGADGHAPVLKRMGARERQAILGHPAYSQNVRAEHVASQRAVMQQLIGLLQRAGVSTAGARIDEYPVRRSRSMYPAPGDGAGAQTELRLSLTDGLSFVTQVGFRYCVDKSLRASAAAVYWRTLDTINRHRLWMAERIADLHRERPALSFAGARAIAAAELDRREVVVFPHYSTLAGHDRFDRLPRPQARRFKPLHRDACGFPSPIEVLREIGAREWFARLGARESADFSKRYCVDKESLTLPTFTLKILARRDGGRREVFDISVDDIHAFIAGTVSVHNCIGNSGPLASPEVESAVQERDLNVVAVLSGNRNFEGRVHPLARSSYLASPPLVVAYALAGTVNTDLTKDPLGTGTDGRPVYLADIWPTNEEVASVVAKHIRREQYDREYARIFTGDENWQKMAAPTGPLYQWDPDSTYVQEPPFFSGMQATPDPVRDIVGARALVLVGDSITTDHISPAGSFSDKSPAGRYLLSKGVQRVDFNQYGTRRGNHEVLMRGTFANIRLRNKLVEKEGYWTVHLPDGEEMTIFDAAVRYKAEGIPLIVIAGKEYGSGSSRDWAAKGPALLGVRAAIVESFERIHRSNLVGMGVLPLEFMAGEGAETLGLTGRETFAIRGLDAGVKPKQTLSVEATRPDGTTLTFAVRSRIDNNTDAEYLRHGGVLPMVVRQLQA